MKQITIEQARQIDLVDYLHSAGHQPQKVHGNDYWFLSPLRDEKTPSFKVNRRLNVWYDFGLGKGGNFIDFGILFHRCTVAELLQKVDGFCPVREPFLSKDVLRMQPGTLKTHSILGNAAENFSANFFENPAGNSGIKITDAREISDTFLLNYLRQRRINLSVANAFCKEVYFTLNDKNYRAIGFKNNAGGYEIRNAYFKGAAPQNMLPTLTIARKS